MKAINNEELDYWKLYRSILEDYEFSRNLEDFISQLRSIVSSSNPNPPIDLLTEVAIRFQNLKNIDDAKKAYGRILQLDNTHKDTWKNLSSLYFKIKDLRKGEFCLQKYYALMGDNPQLKKGTQLRLASSGYLKSLPSNKELGLQNAQRIKSSAPKHVMTLSDFEKCYKISPKSLPKSIQQIIQFGQHQIVDYRLFEKQQGEFGFSYLDIIKNENLVNYLQKKGITKFYKFQEEAFEAINDNEDICIVAPTGNGKTEAFLLPSLLKIQQYKGYGVQLLLIYPMKALAKDQLRKIENFASILDLSVKVFDGDTSHYQRKKIFTDPPEILITNPDIIHYHLGIGNNANLFQNLLAGLKIVILDEIHSYSGTFGSNMYFIIRRLERMVSQKLQFIGASATIANADLFVSKLLGRSINVIECKNGRRGNLHFLILAPYSQTSTLESTRHLITSIKGLGKILIFQDSHRGVELLYQKLGGVSHNVGIHRAGLDKKIREQVESDFRDGIIDLLIATPTLELGIDIGDLDIVITPPISVNRAMQRIGRAGRKGQDAIAVILLNYEDPISNYYYNYPERYYNDIEDVFFEPNNPTVAEHQLLSASLDSPIDINQGEFADYAHILDKLVSKNLLKQIDKSILIATDSGQEAARKYSIRGKNHEIMIKIRGGKGIGKRSMPLAMLELHPGAFYYAAGRKYRVANFHFSGVRGTAELVEPKSSWGSTFPLSSIKPEILEINSYHKASGLEVAYVETKILHTVFGYTLESPNGTSMHHLRDPLYYSSRTKGLLFRTPSLPSIMLDSDRTDHNASLHALVHVILHASLPFIGGQIHEIGGLILLPQGYILLFDQATGSGVCAILLNHLTELFNRAKDILNCDCKDPQGCPRCTFLPRCSHNNTKLDKLGALKFLSLILDSNEVKLNNNYNNFSQTFY